MKFIFVIPALRYPDYFSALLKIEIKSSIMSRDNILLKITEEKNRMINEVITNFLGHPPGKEDKKQFNIINQLGESIIYYRGELICSIRYKTIEDKIAYESPEVIFSKDLPKKDD